MSNDELAELPALTRLLFIYLWMLADREGRLEDKPNRIAAQAIPYDREADANHMLDDLAEGGFITRYTAGVVRCIQIVSFTKHQNPHSREVESELPEQASGTTKAVTKHDLGSDKARPSACSARLIPSSLIPDSLSLIPDVKTLPAAPTLCEGFAQFWEAWPKSTRKAAKDQCLAKWKAKGCEEMASQVIDALEAFKHCEEWMKESGQFIPAPLVWLNQSRWEASSALEAEPVPAGYV